MGGWSSSCCFVRFGARIIAAVGLVAGSVLLQACAVLNVGYEAETQITPSDRPGEYIVQFNITENFAAGGSRLVSAPRLRLREGSEGEVTLGDESSSLKCGALVRREEKGITATTSVRIKRGNRRVWTAQQAIVLTEMRPGQADKPAPEIAVSKGKE